MTGKVKSDHALDVYFRIRVLYVKFQGLNTPVNERSYVFLRKENFLLY